jgi:hypothetical protein
VRSIENVKLDRLDSGVQGLYWRFPTVSGLVSQRSLVGHIQIVAVHFGYRFVQLSCRSYVLDDIVGDCQPLFARRLRLQYPLRLFGAAAVACPQSLQLQRFRRVDQQHPVGAVAAAAFGQQWHDQYGIGRIGLLGELTHASFDQGMQQVFQKLSLLRVVEDPLPELATVQVACGVEDLPAEPMHDGIQRGFAGFNQFAADPVGIDNRNAEIFEDRAGRGFAAGDSAGQYHA